MDNVCIANIYLENEEVNIALFINLYRWLYRVANGYKKLKRLSCNLLYFIKIKCMCVVYVFENYTPPILTKI